MTQFDAEQILQTARDAFVVMDDDGVIVGWNRAAEAIFGYSADEAIGQLLSPLIVPERYRAEHDAGVARFLATRESAAMGEHRDYEAVRRSGEVFPAEITHWWADDGGRVMFYAFIRDISDQRARESELARSRAQAAEFAHRSLHDDLTGLAARSLGMEHITQALARRSRYGGDIAVLFVDLDRFKLINDNLGHAAGDEILRVVAARLRAVVRSVDAVTRVAGDEFLVLCDQLADPAEAESIADRVVAALAEPVAVAGETIRIRSSVGIAIATDEEVAAEDLVRNADAAMYRAKELGRGRVAVFDQGMRERMRNRLRMERELAECLERDELVVQYRPIMKLSTSTVVGVQPIVCWQHPRLGLLEPVEYTAIAEQIGLMSAILLWGDEQWSEQVERWERATGSDLFLNIDLTTRQLSDQHLVDALIRSSTRRRHGGLRIFTRQSRTALTGDFVDDTATLEKFNTAGVAVGIHGFGSSESYLDQVTRPVYTMLKLDPDLVTRVAHEPRRQSVARAVIAMAGELGMTVFVDGVSTGADCDCLISLGCDYALGDYFGAPVAADGVPAWL